MRIYTIGFREKTAERFFQLLKDNHIKQIIDIRENPITQLAGFTKKDDLAFFTHEVLRGSYLHLPELSPDKRIRSDYKLSKDWDRYVEDFLNLMKLREIDKWLIENQRLFIHPFVLLCSEPTPDRCHRSIVAEILKERLFRDAEIIHL